ncbi:hypothetical protein [Geoglobus sp.]
MLLAFFVIMPAAGLSITPDKQLIKPGKNYSFVVEGADEITEVVVVNNVTKARVNWKVEVEGDTITINVPKDAEFAEYLLRVKTDGEAAEARMIIKPPLTVMLATFAVPIFLSVGMLGGGVYTFAKKKGILRYVGITVALIGAFILFGVTMAIVAMQMV